MARQKFTPAGQVVLGAVAALLLAVYSGAAGAAWSAAVIGGLAGYVWSIVRQPMAGRCRIPRILGGCGGSNKVTDGAGNWRPKRPCWRHPQGPPRRFGAILIGRARPDRD